MDKKLLENSINDQKILRDALELIREKSKDRPMFNALTESLRRKIAKKLIYENVTDEQFLIIREQVIEACKLRTAQAENATQPAAVLNENTIPAETNKSEKITIKFSEKAVK